jgi:phosphoketolase
MPVTLSAEETKRLNDYWFAANYLTVGQIYLLDNPMLDRPLTPDDIKPRLLSAGTLGNNRWVELHLYAPEPDD